MNDDKITDARCGLKPVKNPDALCEKTLDDWCDLRTDKNILAVWLVKNDGRMA